MNQELTPLKTALENYKNKDIIPFDVPGHKHGAGTKELRDFFGSKLMEIDVNSMKCLDILSNPVSVIKEAQLLLADAYNCDYGFFLVNGTTCGIQAMIMSICKPMDKIILPRNVHKSALNGLILSGAVPIYINPKTHKDLKISMNISFKDVKKTIDENPDAKAIFVINPTYFGFVSDLKRIIEYAHKKNLIVLVDEAHGSHFNFHDDLPNQAMKLGADMSCVSLHKTGGSLTQSSALLINEQRIKRANIQNILNLTQSTSASYLLMSSLDLARKILATRGQQILANSLKLARYAREEINKIDGLYAFSKEIIDNENIYNFDETKLAINVSNIGISGFEVYDLLRDNYNIQIELADSYNILAIISLGDTINNIKKLIEALKDIVLKYKKEKLKLLDINLKNPEVIISPRDAFYTLKTRVKLEDSIGEISGESIMAYPPGIPIIAPGERITKDIIKYLRLLQNEHTVITGLKDSNLEYIEILKH